MSQVIYYSNHLVRELPDKIYHFLPKQGIITQCFYNFSTHLYGRRLVLEWAEEEETVDDLRRKTANSFVGNSDNNSQSGPPAKRAKVKSAVVESLQTL